MFHEQYGRLPTVSSHTLQHVPHALYNGLVSPLEWCAALTQCLVIPPDHISMPSPSFQPRLTSRVSPYAIKLLFFHLHPLSVLRLSIDRPAAIGQLSFRFAYTLLKWAPRRRDIESIAPARSTLTLTWHPLLELPTFLAFIVRSTSTCLSSLIVISPTMFSNVHYSST